MMVHATTSAGDAMAIVIMMIVSLATVITHWWCPSRFAAPSISS
jgi:hypothetical protein